MNYWQLASGDKTRDYSQVFLDFGVACVGPGNPGLLSNETKHIYERIGEWNKIAPITEIKCGDKIILRNGRSNIQAVGEVLNYEDKVYNYSNCFNDIDGWDLQHFVKVRWKPITLRLGKPVLRRDTMSRLLIPSIIEEIDKLWNAADFIEDKYNLIANSYENSLSYDELEQYLVNLGMGISNAENTSSTIRRVEKLANWYISNDNKTTEHEIRTFLVVPFLEALGWTPQGIGIEVSYGKKIDILLYRDSNRLQPEILVETKRMYEGSALAFLQAKEYVLTIEALKGVKKILITDGLRYWLYEKTIEDWQPIAYMNFRNKQRFYSAYPQIKGMLDLIGWIHK